MPENNRKKTLKVVVRFVGRARVVRGGGRPARGVSEVGALCAMRHERWTGAAASRQRRDGRHHGALDRGHDTPERQGEVDAGAGEAGRVGGERRKGCWDRGRRGTEKYHHQLEHASWCGDDWIGGGELESLLAHSR